MYQHRNIPQPKWDSKHNKWVLSIMIDGCRKQFTSSQKGMPGKRACRDKAVTWLENGASTPGNSTVATVIEEYKKEYLTRHGNNEQFINIESICRNFIIPAIGNKKCSSIAIKDWQGILNNAKPMPHHRKDGSVYYRAETLSKKYLKNIKGVITSFCKWAIPRHYIQDYPSDLYIPAGAPTKGKEILQLSDIEKLFKDPTGLWYERALMFEVLTGWRPGEVIGLQKSDYDPVTGIVTINRAINRRGMITPGKNKNAHRSIELTPEVKQILDEQIEETAYLESEWIFCNPIGFPARQDAVADCWKRIVKHKGLPENTSPYSLRHTFYTHTEAYLPDRVIKSIFGHSDKTDGHSIYGAHAISEEAHEAAEMLSVTPIYQTAFSKEKAK